MPCPSINETFVCNWSQFAINCWLESSLVSGISYWAPWFEQLCAFILIIRISDNVAIYPVVPFEMAYLARKHAWIDSFEVHRRCILYIAVPLAGTTIQQCKYQLVEYDSCQTPDLKRTFRKEFVLCLCHSVWSIIYDSSLRNAFSLYNLYIDTTLCWQTFIPFNSWVLANMACMPCLLLLFCGDSHMLIRFTVISSSF